MAKRGKNGRKSGKRRSRRGLRGELTSQGSHFAERMSRLDAEREAAGWESMSPAKVAKSEAKAENRGCRAPKGKVCVGADVAKIGKRLRKGCRPRGKGNYVCTESALKMHAAGRKVVAGRRAGKGLKVVSWKRAVNKSNGLFNKGCHYSFRLKRPVCKSKRAA